MADLRILTFNVNGMDKYTTDAHMAAVASEISSHTPDIFGLQEDYTSWTNSFSMDGYNVIRPSEDLGSYERCAIFYKNTLTPTTYGWRWLTVDNTKATLALTYDELTDNDGTFDMTADELTSLGVTDSETLRGAANSVTGLFARRMTWAVFEVGAQKLICVNTHLQHRSQNAANETQLKLRNYERLAQYALVQEQIEALKASYPGASVVLMGDFNDLIGSDVYNRACESYHSASLIAGTTAGEAGTWNNYYTNADATTYGTDTLDYVFVSQTGVVVNKYATGIGYATVGGEKVYTSDHRAVIVDLSI